MAVTVSEYHILDGIFAKIWLVDSEAPFMLFLHEALGSVSLWRSLPEKMAETLHVNVIAYDRAGHGQSRPADYTRDHDYHWFEATKVADVLDALGIAECHIMGHSDGGSIGLSFAAQHPDRALSLFIYGAHTHVDNETISGINETVSDPAINDIVERLKKHHGDKTQDLFEAWHLVWRSEAFQKFDLRPRVGAIQCPTLILQGSEDQYASPEHPFEIARAVGENARAVVLNGLNHFPNRDHPDVVIGMAASLTAR